MESSFSLKPQAFSLTARAPVSWPLSTRPVSLLRSEFLGCGHNLRLPRRRCKKLRLKSQPYYYKFLFKATLESQQMLVVVAAFAAVSAITVVYFTYSRKQFDVKQMSGRLTLAVSQHIRSMMSWILTDSHRVDLRKIEAVDGSNDFMKETRESNQADKGMEAEIKFRETDVIPRGILIEEASRSQSDMVASRVHDNLTSKTSKILEISSMASVSSEYSVPSFIKGVCEHENPNSVDSEWQFQKCRQMGAVPPSANHIQEETAQLGSLKLELLEEGDMNHSNLIFKDSERKELHTINMASLEKLDNLEPLSPYSTLQKNSNYSSLLNNSLAEGSNLTAHSVTLSIGKFEEERPPGYQIEGFFCQQQDSRNRKELRKKGKNIFHPDRHKKLSSSSNPKEKNDNDKHNPSWQLRVYNQLLREGRLNDCIELLEDLEEKGLLDMDKVYHARFFDVCKSQKAVKEAFRFTKLIPNPTLSTFNMLMSVCASSQDSEGAFQVLQHVQEAGLRADCKLYTTLISTCAKSGKVDTMFKNVNPDRVVFNALITACGQSGAVDRAFDVLAEMRAELQPIDPDHVTIGALMKACASADQMFISALIDVAGHAGKVDAAFEILQEARAKGMHVGTISYSSLMGACSKARDWQKAVELYEGIKNLNLKPTVSMMNALITALCDADQLQKAMETLSEMKGIGLCPNTITYSILLVASEKKDDLEAGLMLISQAKKDGVSPNLVMCRCLLAMCLRRFQAAFTFGEPVLSFTFGQVQLNSKWTSLALMVYRETIVAGAAPTKDELSQVLGCLQLPHDVSVQNLLSLIDGFGEYDPRAFSLLEVYFLTVLKGLKHRLAAGSNLHFSVLLHYCAKLPNVHILLPIEKAQIQTSAGEKMINIASRISQAVAALLRRLGLSYQGNESYGKIRINGVIIRKWFQPKLGSPYREKKIDLSSSSIRHLGSGISRQQRKIRTVHLSLE
ncbi:UNVERIFIED_CONTAM: Pentatricopeptide repeat-containing protein MRL1, chloroplastic [Sesamum angustifolium]|uniref:Pentatricopeptide repeat-containing protein MRL1, chloroplastic n=1 Tax=Sesamum angustifolium TaxID=2727405 RepID=A0AAW2QCM9_9LAMI